MNKIGFSTGVLNRALNIPIREVIKICREINCNAIEINCNNPEKISELQNIKSGDLQSFEYISIHAPKIIYKDNKNAREILKKIEKKNIELNSQFVIIHPDMVKNWKIFEDYNFKIAIENMDNNKPAYRSIKEIKKLIQEKNYKAVLDLNHCYVNDNSLKLAENFFDRLNDKIIELHLSGYVKLHDPLFKTKQLKILETIPKEKNIPIIIESHCANKEEMRKELNYIKNFLNIN